MQEGGYVRTTRYPKLIRKAGGLLILVQNVLNKWASAGADELINIGNVQVAIRIALLCEKQQRRPEEVVWEGH
jgi:hypothetical protein